MWLLRVSRRSLAKHPRKPGPFLGSGKDPSGGIAGVFFLLTPRQATRRAREKEASKEVINARADLCALKLRQQVRTYIRHRRAAEPPTLEPRAPTALRRGNKIIPLTVYITPPASKKAPRRN